MPRRVHVAVNVADLPAALAFYRLLFAAEPVRETASFAKFELDEPNLNFALNATGSPPARPGVLAHLGFQVDDEDAVRAYAERWRAAGLPTRTGDSVAGEAKVWAHDPDGNEWEVFFA